MTQPQVELFIGPDLATEARAATWAFELRDDPVHAIHHAFNAARMRMVRDIRGEMARRQVFTAMVLNQVVDDLWKINSNELKMALAPIFAWQYRQAFRAVQAGRVDAGIINALAEAHVIRMGTYFNETSKEALLQGFNTYVNRQVPARVALERIVGAYGLTPRQMSGLTSLKVAGAVESGQDLALFARAKQYVADNILSRLKVFAKQEAHNLDNQASQVAWLWMVEKGRMDPATEKIWITAKDEKVCPICGPLHGVAVPVTEQFTTDDGIRLWVPGAHVNCRCWIRVRHPLRNLPQPVQKDLYGSELAEFNDLHPRGHSGRFRLKTKKKPQLQLAPRPVHTAVEDEEIGFYDIVDQLRTPGGTLTRVKTPARVDTPTPEQLRQMVSYELPPIETPTIVIPRTLVARAVPVLFAIEPEKRTDVDIQEQVESLIEAGTTPEQLAKTSQEIDAAVGTKVEKTTLAWSFLKMDPNDPRNDALVRQIRQLGGLPADKVRSFNLERWHMDTDTQSAKDQLVTQSHEELNEKIDWQIADNLDEKANEEGDWEIYSPSLGEKTFVHRDQLRTVYRSLATGQVPEDFNLTWYDTERESFGVFDTPGESAPLRGMEAVNYVANEMGIEPDDVRVDLYVVDTKDLHEDQIRTDPESGRTLIHGELSDIEMTLDPEHPWLRVHELKPSWLIE